MIKITTYILHLLIVGGLISCKDSVQKDKIKISVETKPDSTKIKSEIAEDLTLIFGGDLMMHYPQITSAKQEDGSYSFSDCFKNIKSYWNEADAVIVNLETTLSDTKYSGYPMFAAPYQLAEDLKNSGVTHLVTANNHTCDKGTIGIENTIKYLNNAGLHHTGCFLDSTDYENRTPIFIEKGGFKVALLNYTYGTNGMPIPKGRIVPLIDTTAMRREIIKAQKANATNIITYVHWGNEYQSIQSMDQEKLALWLHRAGVDIVIGSHSHVVQPLEYHVSKDEISGITVYSMGNIISNQRRRKTDGGIHVKLNIQRKEGKSKYIMRYKSWYVDKRGLDYVIIDENINGYQFLTKKDSLDAVTFFSDTKKLLGGELSQ